MLKSIRTTPLLVVMLLAALPASSWGYGPLHQPRAYAPEFPYAPSSRPAGIYIKKHASEDNYYLTVYLRNLSPEQLRVDLSRGTLVLHTLRVRQSAGANPYGGFQTKGFQRYKRRIPLPTDADAQKMSVQRQDGRVTVTIPRRER